MNTPKPIGRLAMRQEGMWWVAYYAMPDTMDGAVMLGKIAMRFVQTQERRSMFMAIMRECVADIFEDKIGRRPEWPQPEGGPAPERNAENVVNMAKRGPKP